MSKIKFFLNIIFAPIFLFFIMNCIVFVSQLKVLNDDSSIWFKLPFVFSIIGIGFFTYYIYKSIKNKVIIINIDSNGVSVIANYASVMTVISSILLGYETIMPIITFWVGNCTNVFIMLTFMNIAKMYEGEFVDEFKMVYADSKYKKWFLLFNKDMFNLNVKFDHNGVMINNSYIEKDSIEYYEDMFEKRLGNLNKDELKLIEMHAI